MNQKEKDRRERIERMTFVLGIFAASIIGFVLNVYANLFYEVYVKGTIHIYETSPVTIAFLFYVLIQTIAFLQFLIYDHKYELNLDRPFLKRYIDYSENVFWFNRLTKSVARVVWLIFKWFFILLFAFSFYATSGISAACIWLIIVFTWVLIKSIYKRRYGKNKHRKK